MSELESIDKTINSKREKVKSSSLVGKSFKGQLGGARPGAGMPKGTITKPKARKMAIEKSFRERVQLHADHLFNAQYDLAVGEKYLMVRRRIGSGDKVKYKTEVVTDVHEEQLLPVDHEEQLLPTVQSVQLLPTVQSVQLLPVDHEEQLLPIVQ